MAIISKKNSGSFFLSILDTKNQKKQKKQTKMPRSRKASKHTKKKGVRSASGSKRSQKVKKSKGRNQTTNGSVVDAFLEKMRNKSAEPVLGGYVNSDALCHNCAGEPRRSYCRQTGRTLKGGKCVGKPTAEKVEMLRNKRKKPQERRRFG